jgi:hypothetical protein
MFRKLIEKLDRKLKEAADKKAAEGCGCESNCRKKEGK